MSFPTFTPPAAEDYIDVILEQYRESPNLLSLVSFVGEETDSLLVANAELYQFYDVDAMGGVNLDILGRIVDVPRDGDTDMAYRPRIKLGLSSDLNGTPDEIMSTIRSVFGATYVEYIPEYPAGFFAYTDAENMTREELERISPAGVGAYPACLLSLCYGGLLDTTTGDHILLVGPCKSDYPVDNIWDGGVGAVTPASMTLAEEWPFRDGDGIGEHPSGGLGEISPIAYTFKDGTFADGGA